HGPRSADAVGLQEGYDPADGFLLLPALADELHAALADALDLQQEGRALVDDIERFFAEGLDDLAGEVRADALDQAAAQVLGDALGGVRRGGPQLCGLELQAVDAVLHPVAAGRDVLAGDGVGEVADERHQFAAALGLDAQHGVPIFGVVVGDGLNG